MHTTLLLLSLAVLAFASIPARPGVRFKEVTGNHLGPNSVDLDAMQEFAISTNSLENSGVTNAKMGDNSISSLEVSPGAVTNGGASIDIVRLTITDGTIFAQSQTTGIQLSPDHLGIVPEITTAVAEGTTPYTGNANTFAPWDLPSVTNVYKVEGKARGPGVILGWYPVRNGHLLRYQASRALRGIFCSDVDLLSDSYTTSDGATVGIAYGDNWIQSVDCDAVDTSLAGCTRIDGCAAPQPTPTDNHCVAYPDGTIGGTGGSAEDSPDRCGRYTSVDDVNHREEGTSVYSPSLERITIDDTGLVEMWFFGRGGQAFDAANPVDIDVEVDVVVLLDSQYGTRPQF